MPTSRPLFNLATVAPAGAEVHVSFIITGHPLFAVKLCAIPCPDMSRMLGRGCRHKEMARIQHRQPKQRTGVLSMSHMSEDIGRPYSKEASQF